MKIEKSMIIGASKSRVWDVLTDFRNYPVWLRSNEKVEVISRESIGEGARFRVIGVLAGNRYSTENRVVKWKEDEKLVVITTSLYGDSYSTYNLKWIPGGCQVIYTVEILLSNRLQGKDDKESSELNNLIYESSKRSVDVVLDSLKNYIEH